MLLFVVSCSYPELPRLPVQDGGMDAVGEDPPPPLGESQSCNSLPSTCGWMGNESCCSALLVSGGMFYREYDVANDVDSGNRANPALVSAFLLDKFEVTTGRFAAFAFAEGQGTQERPPIHRAGEHPQLKGSGWNEEWDSKLAVNKPQLERDLSLCRDEFGTWNAGLNNLPINCVSWYEAMAFCIWDGGYLPTEAELNFAAAGGSQQRVFPWSQPPNAQYLDPLIASFYCLGDSQPECSIEDISPVGFKRGDGSWGHSDLGGNVREWTLDWFEEFLVPCVDCARIVEPANSTGRSVRGGDFQYGYPRTNGRTGNPPLLRNPLTGFRCARPAP